MLRPTLIITAGLVLATQATPLVAVDPGDPLIGTVNRERVARGAPPLAVSPALTAYAQARADEIAASGVLRSRDSSAERGARLLAAGYEAYVVSEVMAEVTGGADAAFDWRRSGGETFAELLRAEFRDVGVGGATVERGKKRSRRVQVVVVGLSWPDLFAERTAGLEDLATVRTEMLARVNDERRAHRRSPLRMDARLNRVAQEYAERMLRDSFYGHRAPSGDTVLDRSRAASYPISTVAENLALGPWSVEEAVEGWMDSPGHRGNILDLSYRDLGVGVAFGRNDSGWQVIWVQVFGLPRG